MVVRAEEELPAVPMDRNQMDQVLINVIRNAAEAIDRNEALKKKIEETAKQLADAKTKADAAVKAAETFLTEAKKVAASATGESKAGAEKTVAEAQTKLDDAKKAAADAAASVKKADDAKKQVAADATAAAARAKEKDVKFTVYSLPVALKIVAAPAPKK